MKPKLELTNEEIEKIHFDHDLSTPYVPDSFKEIVRDVLKAAAAKLPEIPEPARWIPITERMPTEADGLSGSTNTKDNGAVYWMREVSGASWAQWSDPPPGAVAYLPLPACVPPALTPEETDRKEFEAWFGKSDLCLTQQLMAWDAWQAARAKGGSAS